MSNLILDLDLLIQFGMSAAVLFFSAFVVPAIVIRIFIRDNGRRFFIFLALLLQFMQLFLIKTSISLVIFQWITGVFVFLLRKLLKKLFDKALTEQDLLLFFDQLTLQMAAGVSLNAAFRQILRTTPHFKSHFPSNDLSLHVSSTKKPSSLVEEHLKQLKEVSLNPSSAYEMLQTTREALRLRVKLHSKQDVVVSQATAQAVITLLLYLSIGGSQLLWNPDFKVFLNQPVGKISMTISLCLLGFGVFLLRKMSRPRELTL